MGKRTETIPLRSMVNKHHPSRWCWGSARQRRHREGGGGWITSDGSPFVSPGEEESKWYEFDTSERIVCSEESSEGIVLIPCACSSDCCLDGRDNFLIAGLSTSS